MQVDFLKEEQYSDYEHFLLDHTDTLIYSTIHYKNFIDRFTGAKPLYLVATESNVIVGALPLFLKENDTYGNVINSLPFYGTNGGLITTEGRQDVKLQLLKKYFDLLEQYNCISGTIITSPFDKDVVFYEQHIPGPLKDYRIGQLTNMGNDKEKLMDLYHSKTRNMVRKALKSNFTIIHENGLDYLDFLIDTHKENMVTIGGLYKPAKCFHDLVGSFIYNKELRIYVALENDVPVAALLLLYYNKTTEYFCPVTVGEYKDKQPMSALVYTAMQDAVDMGYQWWNWGGTWATQTGVYDFKKRWGTTDMNYYYYTTLRGEHIKKLSKETLLREYPYFFVLPFSLLNNSL